MSQVIVVYESGRVWICKTDPMGEADAEEICAAAGTVELVGDALVFVPAVLPWRDGIWRAPQGIVDQWTSSTAGYIDKNRKRNEQGGGSMYTERETVSEPYPLERYVLLDPVQLEGAISVSIDGVLAYAREDGRLASAVSDMADASGEDMASEFSTANRPAMHETIAGLAHNHADICHESELM